MLETLVLYVCIQGIGCQDTINAYYLQNKELQESVKVAENSIRNAAGEQVSKYVYPLALTWYLNQNLIIPLGNNFYAETNKTASYSKLRWSYEF